MSEGNVEIVRRAYEAFNDEAFDPAAEPDLEIYDPDIELDNSNAVFDATVYRGHEGLLEFVSLLRAMWKRQRFEPQEFIPIGEDRVVVPIRMISVGRDEVETVAHAATVFTVREGKITRMKAFQSRAEALEAVDVTE
jgi:ketosteroid isomerase-like protein